MDISYKLFDLYKNKIEILILLNFKKNYSQLYLHINMEYIHYLYLKKIAIIINNNNHSFNQFINDFYEKIN